MAKAKTIELLPATTITADSEGLPIKIPNLTMAIVGVALAAATGTTVKLSVWLQVSDDGGTTWYDMPYDLQLKTQTGTADPSAVVNKRNILSEMTETDDNTNHLAVYKHIPADFIKLKYAVSGTSPSYAVSASLVGK